jgi:FemAB family protein
MHSGIAGVGVQEVKEGKIALVAAAITDGAQATLRQNDTAAWNKTLLALHYIPAVYSSASIDYQLAYQRGHAGEWWDISMILHHDHRPCGVWPLSFSITNERPSISSHGLPVLPPLFAKDLPNRSRKTQIQNCLRVWDQICVAGGVADRHSAESFIDRQEQGLSEWHDQFLRHGGRATLKHELFVDLSLDLAAIKARFRKSYKSLISSGTRLWDIGDMTTADLSIWSEFRELHVHVSGRATRCAESWQLQHQAIAAGDAFLVFLRNGEGKMVGGGFFSTTRDEGVYGVGAYDRSLFEKPLGHVVQFRAIELMKHRKLRWYKIGQRFYPYERPPATDKELAIAEFKQGFATHLFPQYVLQNDNQFIEA